MGSMSTATTTDAAAHVSGRWADSNTRMDSRASAATTTAMTAEPVEMRSPPARRRGVDVGHAAYGTGPSARRC